MESSKSNEISDIARSCYQDIITDLDPLMLEIVKMRSAEGFQEMFEETNGLSLGLSELQEINLSETQINEEEEKNKFWDKKISEYSQRIKHILNSNRDQMNFVNRKFLETSCERIPDIYAGLIRFFLAFFEDLSYSNKMEDFYDSFPFPITKNFTEYASQLERCDSDIKSYIIFGIDQLNKYNGGSVNYWFSAHINRCKTVEVSFKNRFFELAQLSFFKNAIISQSIVPNEVSRRYDGIISTALLRIRLVHMESGFFGLTVPTKYIFIRAFRTNDPEFMMAGVFLVFLHEMAHYIKRYQAVTYGDMSRIKYPTNEGGFDVEIELFGKKITKLHKDAAKFLMNDLNEANFEFFLKKMRESEDALEEFLPMSRSCFSFGTCGFASLMEYLRY